MFKSCQLNSESGNEGSCESVPTVNICPVQSETQNTIENLISNWLETWSSQIISEMQENDNIIGPILKLKLKSDEKPTKLQLQCVSDETIKLWSKWEVLEIKENVLYKRDKNVCKLVAPLEIRNFIFEQLHHSRLGGHFGIERTTEAVKRRFYWPNMTEHITRWCKECNQCAKRKPGPGLRKAALKTSDITKPLDRIGIDILGPLPITRNGNEYIMVICDYFSKWTEAYAIPDHTAITVADKLMTEFISKLGCPKQIHTDQGREFESQLFATLCSKLGIDKTRTTPYRPQSDGLVELFNRTIQQMLSMFVNENRNDWDDHLPYLTMAYRATVQKSTSCTPNLVIFGRELNCPIDLMIGTPSDQNNFCPSEYVDWLQNAMRDTFNFVYEHSHQAATRQKNNYDIGLKPRSFTKDDWVWRWYPPKAKEKLGLGWTGPYLVINKISDLLYDIQRNESSPILTVHVDHLKPYTGNLAFENWTKNSENTLNISETEHSENTNENSLTQLDASITENEISNPPSLQFKTTRTGRKIRPRNIYSP